MKNLVNLTPCCMHYTATTQKRSSVTEVLRLDKSLSPHKGDIIKQINKLPVTKSRNQSREQEKNVVRQNFGR